MSAPGTKQWTILEVLDWTRGHFEKRGLDSPRLDAEVLIAHALGIQRVMLYARYDAPLDAAELTTIRELVARRANNEPVAHLTGKREFWSISFEVTRDTLVPRPDTETLVEMALDLCKTAPPKLIVDVGTGTGCIALALAKELPAARIFALEISEPARVVAEKNIETLGFHDRVTVLASDLLHALPTDVEPIDLIVANLPYIASAEIDALMADVRDHEPRLALDGGPDGLALIRRLVEQAPARLAPGGAIVLEAGPDQHASIRAILESAGFTDINTKNDAARLPRITSGRTRP